MGGFAFLFLAAFFCFPSSAQTDFLRWNVYNRSFENRRPKDSVLKASLVRARKDGASLYYIPLSKQACLPVLFLGTHANGDTLFVFEDDLHRAFTVRSDGRVRIFKNIEATLARWSQPRRLGGDLSGMPILNRFGDEVRAALGEERLFVSVSLGTYTLDEAVKELRVKLRRLGMRRPTWRERLPCWMQLLLRS